MIGTYFHRQNVEKPPKNKILTLYITKLVSFYHCGVPEPAVSKFLTTEKEFFLSLSKTKKIK